MLKLSKGDERLDRVGPDRLGGIRQARSDEPPRQVGEIPTGCLNIAERELQPPEHGEAEDAEYFVPDRVHLGHTLFGRRPRPLHQTEVRLDQSLHPAVPPPLLGNLVCSPTS